MTGLSAGNLSKRLFVCRDPEGEWIAELELADALERERCNGCGRPLSEWGPVCPGMLQGDWTHYHSANYWTRRLA
jgi:hypothetical protein